MPVGNFKHTGIILFSTDDGGDVWMAEGCTENILLMHYFCYTVLLTYYFGLEVLL
jgi:hypothetical protein